MIRDTIKPDLTMFIHYETLEYEGKFVLCVDIEQGSERPYYVAKKGLRPEGVYVRQGYSSVPASDTAIRKMIKETDGDHFEDMRSLEQDLTFIETEKEFKLRDIDFGIYPYTSASTTLAAYAPIGAGAPFAKLDESIGIMKAYSSCVGEGPFTC